MYLNEFCDFKTSYEPTAFETLNIFQCYNRLKPSKVSKCDVKRKCKTDIRVKTGNSNMGVALLCPLTTLLINLDSY